MKRYSLYDNGLEPDPTGAWVRFDEVERLKQYLMDEINRSAAAIDVLLPYVEEDAERGRLALAAFTALSGQSTEEAREGFRRAKEISDRLDEVLGPVAEDSE